MAKWWRGFQILVPELARLSTPIQNLTTAISYEFLKRSDAPFAKSALTVFQNLRFLRLELYIAYDRLTAATNRPREFFSDQKLSGILSGAHNLEDFRLDIHDMLPSHMEFSIIEVLFPVVVATVWPKLRHLALSKTMPTLSFLSTLPPTFQHLELITPTTPTATQIPWFDYFNKLRNELGWKPDKPKVMMQFQVKPGEHFVLDKEIAKFFADGRNPFLRDRSGTVGALGFLDSGVVVGGFCRRVEVEARRRIFEESWANWRG